MRGLNVERMQHHVVRTAPDTLTLHGRADDYLERLRDWRNLMAAKHGGAGHIDLRLDPATDLVTATFSDGHGA